MDYPSLKAIVDDRAFRTDLLLVSLENSKSLPGEPRKLQLGIVCQGMSRSYIDLICLFSLSTGDLMKKVPSATCVHKG